MCKIFNIVAQNQVRTLVAYVEARVSKSLFSKISLVVGRIVFSVLNKPNLAAFVDDQFKL